MENAEALRAITNYALDHRMVCFRAADEVACVMLCAMMVQQISAKASLKMVLCIVRYLWTKDQMSDMDAHVAGGVRVDVPPPPSWMKHLVEAPLVDAGVLPPNYIDSVALNIYQDGSEGIQSHYDDAHRFCQPIHSLVSTLAEVQVDT